VRGRRPPVPLRPAPEGRGRDDRKSLLRAPGSPEEERGRDETEDFPPSPGAPRAAGVNGSGQGAARRAPSRGPKGPKPPGRGERADTARFCGSPWGGAAGRPMKPSASPFSDLGDGRGGRSGGQGPPPGNAPGTPGEAGRGRRRPQGPAPGTGPERPGGRPGSSGPWRPRGAGGLGTWTLLFRRRKHEHESHESDICSRPR
jgi:hypothetical protein